MKRYTARTALLELIMVTITLIIAFPLYVLVNVSLRGPNTPGSSIAPTTTPTLDNYRDAWTKARLGSAISNSLQVTLLSVLIIVLISSTAAYPLSRVTSRWSRLTFALVILGLIVPFQLAALPLYQTMRDLHLLGKTWGLVLYYSGLQVPFATFLYVGFLRVLPRDYEEAAHLDGAGPVNAFRLVVFPLVRPITGTVAILNAVFIWNDFFTPLLYLSGSGSQTIPVAINSFVGQYISNWNLVFAGLVIGITPILLTYFLMQGRIIKGFAGGLKG